MIRKFSLLGLAAILSACVSATPYQPAGEENRYGFSEQRVEENRYRITFRGNSSTQRETVENSLLFRAAELTIQEGFDYFLVIENDTEVNSTFRTSGFNSGFNRGFGRRGFGRGFGPAFYGRYGFGRSFRRGYSFPYYANGFGWGGGFNGHTREITRYSAIAFVAMFNGEKPNDDANAFDARDVLTNLENVVLGPEPVAE